ncbi:MAG: hypothetical protein ABWY04_06870 [Arthrobacter sp.]
MPVGSAGTRTVEPRLLAANGLGRALYLDLMAEQTSPPDSARFAFLNPKLREFFADWERAADDIVAVLRSTAGKNPYDRDLTDLIGELSTWSEECCTPTSPGGGRRGQEDPGRGVCG